MPLFTYSLFRININTGILFSTQSQLKNTAILCSLGITLPHFRSLLHEPLSLHQFNPLPFLATVRQAE